MFDIKTKPRPKSIHSKFKEGNIIIHWQRTYIGLLLGFYLDWEYVYTIYWFRSNKTLFGDINVIDSMYHLI